MKVMQIATRHNVGGVSAVINSLLEDDSVESIYLYGECEENEKEAPLIESSAHIKTIKLECLKRRLSFRNDILAFFEIRSFLRRHQPDVVHSHMAKAGALARLSILTLSRRPKIVHSFHGSNLNSHFNRISSLMIWLSEFILSFFTDVFVFDDTKTQAHFHKLFIRPRCFAQQILPGVLSTAKEFNKPTPLNSSIKFLIVARLESVKNIGLALEALSEVSRHHSKFSFHIDILGDGNELNKLQHLASRLNLPVSFHGWQSKTSKFYECAQFFLLTSKSEGTPISVMEAMSYGCVVIATNVGGVSDLIEDGKSGVLVSPSGREIAARIGDLITDPEKIEDISRLAILRANSLFLKSRMRTEHVSLYRNIVAS